MRYSSEKNGSSIIAIGRITVIRQITWTGIHNIFISIVR